MKKRILNSELASVVANIRHGEMIFVADAGSGVSSKSLYPLDPDVKYLDLGVVTGSPSFQELVSTLFDVGDFESVIITDLMETLNKKDFDFLNNRLLRESIHVMPYIPEFYEMRDRCKLVVQTGDYGAHAQAILVAGYSTEDIPMEWLKQGINKKGDADNE